MGAPLRAHFSRARVVLADGELVKPLLGFQVSREGGLMAYLCRQAPVSSFRYGVLDLPIGDGQTEAPLRPDEASSASEFAPKLHLHRSGWLSLDATTHLERREIETRPLSDHGDGHLHRFSFIARHPALWKSSGKRKTDIVITASGPPPVTLTVLGHVGPLENLQPGMPPGDANPWVNDLHHDDGTIVPTGIAIVEREQWGYYLWLTFKPNAEFGAGAQPAVILYGFDPDAASNAAQAAEMVAVWSLPSAD